MTEESAWTRLEAEIAAAAAEHAGCLKRLEARHPSACEVNVLLAAMAANFRLAGVRGKPETPIDKGHRREILRQLAAEASRQVRFARAGNRRYDINRHIAVRRAIAAIGADDRSHAGPLPAGHVEPRPTTHQRHRSQQPHRRTHALVGNDRPAET